MDNHLLKLVANKDVEGHFKLGETYIFLVETTTLTSRMSNRIMLTHLPLSNKKVCVQYENIEQLIKCWTIVGSAFADCTHSALMDTKTIALTFPKITNNG